MKRLFALLLAVCLLPAAALAQDVTFNDVYPLVNMTATAVMLTGEQIQPGVTMTDALVQCLLRVGLEQEMGYTSFDVNNIAWRDSYIGAAYASPFGLTSEVAELTEYAYYGVRAMAIDESDDGSAVRILGDVYQADDYLETLNEEQYARVQWLDKRAVVELRRNAAGPGGWQVYSFALDAEWEMEQAAQDYFASTMVEYVNAEWGLSIQYPAVFGEDCITMDENGVSGTLEEASFSVVRYANDQAWTTQTLLEQRKQETPESETNINDITGCGRISVQVEGMVQVTFLMVTEEYVYQAQLSYPLGATKDFALYCDYMMNSFTLDELGVG